MESLWREGVKMPSFGVLEGERTTDVLIIGGGLCGLLCARFLKERGVDCILTEASTLASGTSGGTTGKLTLLHGLVYQKLLQRYGTECAAGYYEANRRALEMYRRMAVDIPCDLENCSAYTYSRTDRRKIEEEVTALQRLGADARFSSCPDLPFDPVGAVRLEGQAQFHPLKFMAGLADGLPIYEHSPVIELRPRCARLPRGTVRAKKIIVATHFPILNKHGAFFLKLYQHRSYLLALDNAPKVRGMYVDADLAGMTFRDYGDHLLLGGGGHRTGNQGTGWKELTDFAAHYYPGARVHCRWAAQDCISLDSMPYVGRYSPKTQDLYVATGFNKWGMTGSMAAAMLLTDLVTDKENDFTDLLSPARSMLHKQLFLNGATSALHLLTPTTRRCPHLGCALQWNAAEHSWDCPCHGSRFTADGKLIDNPATGDLK